MNNSSKQTPFMEDSNQVLSFLRDKVLWYIITAVILLVGLLCSNKWDEGYLIACFFIAVAVALVYRKHMLAQPGVTDTWRILKAYVLVLPGTYVGMVLLGFIIFGINTKSDIYQISFVLCSISALVLFVSGVYTFIRAVKPKNCLKCEAFSQFFLESYDDSSIHTDRYCIKHFSAVLQGILAGHKGVFLVTSPPVNYSNPEVRFAFYTAEDLADWEYSAEDIERVKKLLQIAQQRANGNGQRDTVFVIIPPEYVAPFSENSDSTPLFTCDPDNMLIQHAGLHEFMRWFNQITTRVERINGELYISIPNANAGIFVLETGPESLPFGRIF